MYITITNFNNHGPKPMKLNGIIKLEKEHENLYDSEAISCEMRHFGKIGYVSNSVKTVAMGSMSAGRIYDKIGEEHYAKVKFIIDSIAIAKLLNEDEFKEELKNPDSDIHYLCEDKSKISFENIKGD